MSAEWRKTVQKLSLLEGPTFPSMQLSTAHQRNLGTMRRMETPNEPHLFTSAELADLIERADATSKDLPGQATATMRRQRPVSHPRQE